MAGMEKICEYCEKYLSYEMYHHKRNQLQVCPDCRKHFRGDDGVLVIQRPDLVLMTRWGSYFTYSKQDYLYRKDAYDPPFTSEKEYLDYKTDVEKHHLVKRYDYVYLPKNKELFGMVDGRYYNDTLDLSTTKRKMKRLLRCRKLNIIMVEDIEIYLAQLEDVK